KDPRPEPGGTAAWGVGRFGGEEAFNNLEKSMISEGDSQVRDMLQQALNKLNEPSEKEASAVAVAAAAAAADASSASTPVAGSSNGDKPGQESPVIQGVEPMAVPEGGPEMLYYDELQSPIGPLTVCATEKGLCLIEFGSFYVKEAVIQQWSRTWA
ncbi:tRNA epoxyqueuosine(34) reductase QueG, partial [Clostridium perfringens]